MKNQTAKIIVSLAIGIISWQIAGNLTRTSRYYMMIRGRKIEVPESLYESNGGYTYPKENAFNNAYAIPCGSIAFAGMLIVLFLPQLISKKE